MTSRAHPRRCRPSAARRGGPANGGRRRARAASALRAGLAACAAGAIGLAGVPPSGAGTPSPEDWRDIVIYQVLTDRFADGDPANNAVEGNFAPADGARIHGGDFAGLEARLDYIAHLGAGAIWISPVVLNANAEYHGYAARDFFSIAPHFGTLAELQSLVRAAHARGIYVIIDVVLNHGGDLIDSGDPAYPRFRYPGTYALRWRNPARRHAGVFDDLGKFHAHGHIGDYTDPEQVLGELFALDDLKTEDPAVRLELIRAAEWLIANTDCDGFRLDTVKHVEMGFWDAWTPAARARAVALGKDRFFFFGEVFDGSDVKCASYTGTRSGGAYKLDSVLHFPMYFTANGVFLWDDPPAALSARYANLVHYDSTSRERLVTFLDNHDVSRFLRAGPSHTIQDESRLRAALGWLLTARGAPVLYYGTEQGFDGGGDPWNREDMWDGAWDFGPSDGDNFDLVQPLFRHVRRLLDARRAHPALRRGSTRERYAEAAGPGLYLFERMAPGDTVLVAINTSNAPIVRPGETAPWPPGTILVDAMDPVARDTAAAGGAIALRLPARGVRVLESLAFRRGAAAGERLEVEETFPGHDQSVADRFSPLTLVFDRDVDPAALADGFQILPPTAGTWTVAGRVARFVPAGGAWSGGAAYAWSLAPSVRGADGRGLPARFDATFRTSAAATGVTVPPGFAADRIARQGLAAPEGILPAPWISPHALLVSDTGRDRLFTLTPGGDLGHHLGDSRWTRPEGLARTAAGATAVADETGVYEIDGRRMTAAVAGPSSATQTGAVAFGAGPFGDRLYLCDPVGDRVVRLGAGGAIETFATGVRGGEGLAFGPGGVWGDDLHVSDADLSSLGAPADGPGRVARVSAAGGVATLAQDPALRGASALAFDTGGRFGGDLFVADILGERILRVTPAGEVSVFASGFGNLSGSCCLAFGGDGALYVADAGSGQPFSNAGGNSSPQVVRISRQEVATGVPAEAAAGIELSPPAPNPTAGGVTFRFMVAAPGPLQLAVHDLAGRRVRLLARGPAAAGAHEARWDGADERGRAVRPGLYFARLEAGGVVRVRRVAVVR